MAGFHWVHLVLLVGYFAHTQLYLLFHFMKLILSREQNKLDEGNLKVYDFSHTCWLIPYAASLSIFCLYVFVCMWWRGFTTFFYSCNSFGGISTPALTYRDHCSLLDNSVCEQILVETLIAPSRFLHIIYCGINSISVHYVS